jgi:uncharacterized membrane protein
MPLQLCLKLQTKKLKKSFLPTFLLIAIVCFVYRFYKFVALFPDYWANDDFNHYYGTAWQILRGENPYIRDLATLNIPYNFQWHALTPRSTYPPFISMLLAPLALFPPFPSYCGWIFFNFISILITFLLIIGVVCPRIKFIERLGLLIFFLATNSFFLNMDLGQIQGIIFLLITAGWMCLRKERDSIAGVAFGLAAAIKFFPWLLIPYLFLIRRYKAFIVASMCALGFSALPMLFFGTEIWEGYLAFAKPLVEHAIPFLKQNYSLAAVLNFSLSFILNPNVLPSSWKFVINYALPSMLLLGCIFLIVRKFRTEKNYSTFIDYTMLLVIPLTSLSMPVAWDHYLISLLCSFLFLYKKSREGVLHPGLLFLLWLVIYQTPHFESIRLFNYEVFHLKRVGEWVAILILLISTFKFARREVEPNA